MADSSEKQTVVDRAKELLADPRHRIALDDFVNEHLRLTLDRLSADRFPVSGGGTNDDVVKRITDYEHAVQDLLAFVILIARWGDEEGRYQLEKIFMHVADTARPAGGTVLWLKLRWYPLALLIYAAGVAALAGRRFQNLGACFMPRVHSQSQSSSEALVSAVTAQLLDVNFQVLPGHNGDRFPRSEHLFAILRGPLDRLLFLGSACEVVFDRFEALLALTVADLRDPKDQGELWGPPGRFVNRLAYANNSLDTLIEEATAAGSTWPPLSSGLFRGQSERFLLIARAYRDLIKRHGR